MNKIKTGIKSIVSNFNRVCPHCSKHFYFNDSNILPGMTYQTVCPRCHALIGVKKNKLN